jgi:glycosyltransferase involved in cell wall biosynthesis
MRIAYLCADPGIPVLGHKGASVHLRSLASALGRRDHAVLLLGSNLSGENRAPDRVTLAALTGADLHDRLEAFEPDVVLERYALGAEGGLKEAARLGKPFVLEMNAPLVDEAARYRGLRDVSRWREWEERMVRAADRIIAVSSAIREHALALGAEPQRVTVVLNGVDATLIGAGRGASVRERHGLGRAFVVGFCGSLKPWHGVARLVHAFARLPQETRLLLVGDGPQRPEIERLVLDLGLSGRVTLTGAIPHDRVPDYLAAMDVGVAPYEAQPVFYFSPLKVVEYMAAGLPVIASRQGDLETIVDGAGLLVAAGAIDALTAALTHLLTDDEIRRALGRCAHERASEMTWDQAAERVEEVLARHEAAA